MSLYAPDPDRKGVDHNNACATDLVPEFAKICQRAEQFDKTHDFLVANALTGLVDEFQRKLASFKANVSKERTRVNPRRLVHPKKYIAL